MGVSKVYIPQQPMRKVRAQDVRDGYYQESAIGTWIPSFDLTPALEYGDIELLLDTGVMVGIAMQPIITTFKEKLRDFSDDDFIVPVGDPAAMGIAIALAAQYNAGRVNLLRWDRPQRKYISLKIKL